MLQSTRKKPLVKNTDTRENWVNRHLEPLPTERCLIKIIVQEVHCPETEFLCEWVPSEIKDLEHYIGTARTIDALSIGFHAWTTNNSEFVYYQIVE